jgi:hypothetical protein
MSPVPSLDPHVSSPIKVSHRNQHRMETWKLLALPLDRKRVLWISQLPVPHILRKHARLAHCTFAHNTLGIFVLSKISHRPRCATARLDKIWVAAAVVAAAMRGRATRDTDQLFRPARKTGRWLHRAGLGRRGGLRPCPMTICSAGPSSFGRPGVLAGHAQGRTTPSRPPIAQESCL